MLGVCGPESVCPRSDQRERRAAAGRVRPGHRGDEDQGATPVPLHRRHRLRQTKVRHQHHPFVRLQINTLIKLMKKSKIFVAFCVVLC